MIISHILAMSKNRVIGKDNKLPWHIPEDLKFFKEKTKGHIMIMGRKTFASLPGVLKDRLHIVITRQKDFKIDKPDVVIVDSLEKALVMAKQKTPQWGDEVFIIGGGEIFLQSMQLADRIYLTLIDQHIEGDALYPEFDQSQFTTKHREDRTEPVPYSFITLERKK